MRDLSREEEKEMEMDLDSHVAELQSQEIAGAAHSTNLRQPVEADRQELQSKSATFDIPDEAVMTESPKRTAFNDTNKAITISHPPTSTTSIEIQISDAISTQLPTVNQEMLQKSHEATDQEMVCIQNSADMESQKMETLDTSEEFEMVDVLSTDELRQRYTSDEFIIVDLPTPYTTTNVMFSSPQMENLSLNSSVALVHTITIPQYEIESVASSPGANTNAEFNNMDNGSAMLIDTATIPTYEIESVASSPREGISTKYEIIDGFDINRLERPSEVGSPVSRDSLRINTTTQLRQDIESALSSPQTLEFENLSPDLIPDNTTQEGIIDVDLNPDNTTLEDRIDIDVNSETTTQEGHIDINSNHPIQNPSPTPSIATSSVHSLISLDTNSPRDMSSVTHKKQNGFHVLTPELRERIWKPLLRIYPWCHTYPALIQALRPDEKLYQEALGLLYKYNTFRFDGKRYCGFRRSSPGVLGRIRRLEVEIDSVFGRIPTDDYHPSPLSLHLGLTHCTHLEEVTLYCKSHDNTSPHLISDFQRYFPLYLAQLCSSKYTLRCVTLVIPYAEMLSTNYKHLIPEKERNKLVEKNLHTLDQVVGVRRELIEMERGGEEMRVSRGSGREFREVRGERRDVWRWEVKEWDGGDEDVGGVGGEEREKKLDFGRIFEVEAWNERWEREERRGEREFGM